MTELILIVLTSAWSTYCGYRMGLLTAERRAMKAEEAQLRATLQRFGR